MASWRRPLYVSPFLILPDIFEPSVPAAGVERAQFARLSLRPSDEIVFVKLLRPHANNLPPAITCAKPTSIPNPEGTRGKSFPPLFFFEQGLAIEFGGGEFGLQCFVAFGLFGFEAPLFDFVEFFEHAGGEGGVGFEFAFEHGES